MQSSPSASYSLTLRVKLSSRAGTLGQLATAIGRAGGDIGAIDIVSVTNHFIIRDVTVNAASSEHGEKIVETVKEIDGLDVIHVSDLTFLMHIGGKIEVARRERALTDQLESESSLKARSTKLHEVALVRFRASSCGFVDRCFCPRRAQA